NVYAAAYRSSSRLPPWEWICVVQPSYRCATTRSKGGLDEYHGRACDPRRVVESRVSPRCALVRAVVQVLPGGIRWDQRRLKGMGEKSRDLENGSEGEES
ncbi:MAG: hypothetical protein AB7G75_19005, partial [Candidatus Binatia bacterium]